MSFPITSYRQEEPKIKILQDIFDERERQIKLGCGGKDSNEFDKANSRNDWIAYINAYIGRAADKVFRNQREKYEFRENMVKAAALVLAAIEAYDNGWC